MKTEKILFEMCIRDRNQADEYADRKHGPFEPPGLGAGGGIEEQMNADQHDEEGEKAAQE